MGERFVRKLFFAFIFLISFQAGAEEIIGEWKYKSFIYDGQPYPPSNPKMDMRFIFSTDGISVLRWFVEGEPEFCERKAVYLLENNHTLYQKIVWAHPGNHMSCSSDPDMQLGRESRSEVKIDGEFLYLNLQLGEKPYSYIFQKVGAD